MVRATRTSGAATDIFELLQQDHQRIRALFKQIQGTSERSLPDRVALFSELRDELSAHAHAEQDTFYHALLERVKKRDAILEAYEEHAVAEMLLADLETCEPDDERWMAKLSVLHEMVDHHVEEEESEIFREARKILSEQEATELAEAMRMRKAEEL